MLARLHPCGLLLHLHSLPLQVSAGALAELLTTTGAAAGDPARVATADASADPLTIKAVQRVRADALERVRVPQHVVDLLVDLRTFLQEALEPPTYVSDRRMVKAVQLMKVRRLDACVQVLGHDRSLSFPATCSCHDLVP